MEFWLKILFWTFTGVLAYTAVGYPVILALLARSKRFPSTEELVNPLENDTENWPYVSMLIPAFNEEPVIRQKIENCLALDYPADKLEIVVASDGSTDLTNEMAQAYGENEIQFRHFERRRGKTHVINAIVPELRGEIVVISDASAILELDALKQIVRRLQPLGVGAASGIYRFEQVGSGLREKGEFLYWKYETFLKMLEDATGSVIGAHGALLAFKKRLFEPLPADAINDDFLIPMRILEKGYRVAYVAEAQAVEETYGDSFADYHRRSRIFVGNLQQIVLLKGMLNPLKGLDAWKYVSHKVLRTFSPLLVLGIFVTSLFLRDGLYGLFFWTEMTGLFLLLAGMTLQRLFGATRWMSVPFYVIFSLFAGMVGYFRFLLRRQQVTWNRG